MNIEITGRHIEVTEALRDHATGQFERLEQLFEGKPVSVHLILEVERGRHRTEAVVKWRNDVLAAFSDDPDMYHSIATTVGKIEKQARRLKDKIIDKSHKATKASLIGNENAATD
ncbi:MAG: ribosome-associated translation inhibitor RaiA [Chloracidobacterium sp.]|nr:ribosome-associated translation inhibitor RaiA [Chloracidobacterium sp.]MCC6824332.1 ribosome-associated translation inhibitor RaiA [Acidobacteriota bacterium]MCO5332603.1 ribosome-associated translation inhibitor RaiA [Pyrinomonadaceae bacterium]